MAKKETTKKSKSEKKVSEAGDMKVIKNTTSKKEAPKTSRFSSFFGEFKENISEGAKALKDISSDLFEDAKDKAEDLYGRGSEKFEQASGVVESYVDRFKNEKDIKRLSVEKGELTSILGDSIYHEFMKNGTIAKRFLTTKKMAELFASIESVDKEILKLGRELDKQKK